MSSNEPSDTAGSSAGSPHRASPLDLERDLPTSAEDVAVLRSLRNEPISPVAYADLLRAVGDASAEELAKRPGPRGEPFEL